LIEGLAFSSVMNLDRDGQWKWVAEWPLATTADQCVLLSLLLCQSDFHQGKSASTEDAFVMCRRLCGDGSNTYHFY